MDFEGGGLECGNVEGARKMKTVSFWAFKRQICGFAVSLGREIRIKYVCIATWQSTK